MSIYDEKYKKIFEELIENNCIELDQGIYIIHHYDSIEYLFEQLQKEREINQEFHEYFEKDVKPQEINELVNAYHKSIALATNLTNLIIKENKQLKEQLKHKNALNSCLMYVIELGGVVDDE